MGFKKSTMSNIDSKVKLYIQTYEPIKLPHGSILINQNTYTDDFGGSFKEIGRLNKNGEVEALISNNIHFKPIQINKTKLAPQTKRFWHIHKSQDEIWSHIDGTLNIGLIDLREDSPTKGLKVKIILDENKALFIPAGVAHGFLNPSYTKEATFIYLTNKHWIGDESTEEYRIDPATLDYEFVAPEIM